MARCARRGVRLPCGACHEPSTLAVSARPDRPPRSDRVTLESPATRSSETATPAFNGATGGRRRDRLAVLVRRRPTLAVWCAAFVVLATMSMAWALATPMAGSPDEPAHIIRAVSIVRGELVGAHVPGKSEAWTQVQVPATYAQLDRMPLCWQFHNTQPAGCAPHLVSSSRSVSAPTYVGRYPPLYYLVVGLPSLVSSSGASIYWMRLLSAVVTDAFLALGFAVAWRWSRSRLLVIGVAVAITPTESFLSGVVNPSSWEIAAAICGWVSALVLVLDHRRRPPLPLVVILTVSAVVVCLMRGISPLWLVLVPATMLPLAWGRVPIGEWWAQRSVRVGVVVIAVVGVAAVIMVAVLHSSAVNPVNVPPPSTSAERIVETSIGKLGMLIDQAIGTFGWNDIVSPFVALGVWILGGGLLVGFGVLVAHVRVLVTTVAIALATAVTAVLVPALTARHNGFLGQGRYYLPLAVGLPLVAAAVLVPPEALRRRARTFAVGLAVAVSVGLVGSYLWALRRVTVGMAAPLRLTGHAKGDWAPPVNAYVLLAFFTVVCAGYAVLVTGLLRRPRVVAEEG